MKLGNCILRGTAARGKGVFKKNARQEGNEKNGGGEVAGVGTGKTVARGRQGIGRGFAGSM